MTEVENLMSGLSTYEFRFSDKESGAGLTLGMYRGTLQMTLWGGKDIQSRGPAFKQSFNAFNYVALKKAIHAVATNPTPETKQTMVVSKWDQASSTATPVASIIIGRDNRKQCYIEIQFTINDNARTLRFGLTAGASCLQTQSEWGWEQRSQAMIDALDDWVTNFVPLASVLTYVKPEKQGQGGGGNVPQSSGDQF